MRERNHPNMRKITSTQPIYVAVALLTLALVCFPAASAEQSLFMATTTSTDNTGLLDDLIPAFTRDTGIKLTWTATGTGKALKLGQNCDVDILMVHAPEAEKKFVMDGYGTSRREFMYNDFVIIGPADDPAGIKGKDIEAALTQIKSRSSVFISRGDNSGTHKKEVALWKGANLPVPEKEKWYVQTGQGMLASINIAAERSGYILTDRGTWIKFEAGKKGNPPLKIMVAGDPVLLNQYSVIAVNPQHCPAVKIAPALQFIEWVTGDRAQALIRDFKLIDKPLFTPNAKK